MVNYELTAITDISELRQLRDLYQHDWPKNCVHYYCLDNFIGWLEKKSELQHLHIYTLNKQWRENGLYLIVDRYQLFLGALDAKYNILLAKALALLDWRGGYKVSSFLARHRESVVSVVQEKNLKLEFDSLTVMYYMPATEAAKLEVNCPDSFEIRPLSINDAQTVDDVWPNRHQGSYFLIQRLIAWNISMGVYCKESNELVAWCLRLQGGFLGALQVQATHKRLGLGTIVTRATARRIGELGHDAMALVGVHNEPSRGMFDKIGFKITDTCYWLRTYPTEKDCLWPDNQ